MAKLTLFWTKTALYQRDSVFEYWNKINKSTEYSKRLLKLINKRITIILTFPEIGKKIENAEVRMIIMEHYSILYKQMNDVIIIVSFWDNRQDSKELLKIIKQKNVY